MKTWGVPVLGTMQPRSDSYAPKLGERFACYYEMREFVIAGGYGDSEDVAEAWVLDNIIARMNEDVHWHVLYVEVFVLRHDIPKAGIYYWDANGIVHLEAVNVAITLATIYLILKIVLLGIVLFGVAGIVFRTLQFIGVIPPPNGNGNGNGGNGGNGDNFGIFLLGLGVLAFFGLGGSVESKSVKVKGRGRDKDSGSKSTTVNVAIGGKKAKKKEKKYEVSKTKSGKLKIKEKA